MRAQLRDSQEKPRPRIFLPEGERLPLGGVLTHLRDGLSYSEIGQRLAIAERTARAHVAAIKEKLGAATAAQCVSRGYEMGIFRGSQAGAKGRVS